MEVNRSASAPNELREISTKGAEPITKAKPELQDWVICGRLIGQASGWDQADTWVLQLYDFVPHTDYRGPASDCVCFNFENGTIETFDDSGETLARSDLMDALANLPRMQI